MASTVEVEKGSEDKKGISAPAISLPKGGGAIRGMGEKFAANPVTGTGSMTIPIATSPGRSGFGPQLSLSYDSGAGNGPFGLGWNFSLPSITRKTDKGLPKYQDTEESDVFILSAAEDLVPMLVDKGGGNWEPEHIEPRIVGDKTYHIKRYRPRVEGLFARIEHWTNQNNPEDTFWRSISKDNITTWYGKTELSRIADPADPVRVFSWLICESHDDKGNVITYQYAEENSDGIVLSQAHEYNRSATMRQANRYLKYIKYGNRSPYFPVLSNDEPWPVLPGNNEWMFEVVFDYGEHDANNPLPVEPSNQWPVRNDPFSSYRAGFEVRTYRLCQRVLMFHHFPNEQDIGQNCLVRSTDFNYSYETDPANAQNPVFSFLLAATQTGYQRDGAGGYLSRSLPPLEFKYSSFLTPEQLLQEPIRAIEIESLENLPYGLDGSNYQWVDLDGEGLSGILTEQADGWFYKRNLSANHQFIDPDTKTGYTTAHFGAQERVATKPNTSFAAGQAQFLDLAGDGQADLVAMEEPMRGFYERTFDEDWEPFRAFSLWPNLDTRDPNLRFIDLTGDGHADILISEDHAFVWHASLAEAGFAAAQRVMQVIDEEKGPHLVFADATQSIYLADLSGDGLTDLVRIRNGEVCYWPNLGYCRFGPKVTMDNAPWFDNPDLFDQRHIRLADIDGSGVTDILYLHCDDIKIYFNQSGNSWSSPVALAAVPATDSVKSVTVVDLLGNGTACLVWSSPLPGDARRPMYYLNLMGGQKPHLLINSINNLGAETLVHYAPATKFYLDDKLAGSPWITKLPFPVHVVERVETWDHISGNRFVTRYAFHHGCFDGEEREFRGFGMVEQWDTEEIGTIGAQETEEETTNWDAASFVPPVRTKTWFHTGAFFENGRISKQFEDEYYREGDPSLDEGELKVAQLAAMLLDDTVLPDGLSAEEAREACRSLKGGIMRQEVYALERRPDGTLSEASDRPYTVSERNYTVKRLQPRDDNKYAVFFTHACETVDFHYERKLYDIEGNLRADPRVTHAMTLAVDDYGNVLQSVAIGYGRRFDDPDPLLTAEDRNKQRQTLLTSTDNHYTNPVLENDAYRTPLPCESCTFELVNVRPNAVLPGVTNLFRFDELRAKIQTAGDGIHDLPYEDFNHGGAVEDHPYRRLIEHVCSRYRPDDLGVNRNNDPNALLPLCVLEALALPGESYKLAFTPELLEQVYRRGEDNLLPNPADVLGSRASDGGGYVDLNEDGRWWIPSGRVFYSPITGEDAAQELTFARDHFFLSHRYRDPFGHETTVAYDSNPDKATSNYNLLVVQTRDASGNVVTVETQDDQGQSAIRIDYRVLQPYWVNDPNGNRTRVVFDVLGMVVATAVMGKPMQNLGDSLDNFTGQDANPPLASLHNFVADPRGQAADLLKNASTRIVYDIDRYQRCGQPPFTAVMARETHISDPLPLEGLQIQISFVYSDGFGREVQTKIQAEPGNAPQRAPNVLIDPGCVQLGALLRQENGHLIWTDTNPRWVGTGRTVYNNKGKPVKKYEPFFSSTHLYEPETDMTDTGVTPVLFYDPVERVVATLHPNHTYEKVFFDPWRQVSYDVNDTVTADPRTDEDIQGYVAHYFATQPEDWQTWYDQRIDGQQRAEEQDAANNTAIHADTPTVAFFDTLGRPFLTVAHNRFQRNGATIEEKYATRVVLDIEGNQREVIDAKGRIVMRYDYDLLGNRIHQASMEAGERWMLNNVAGKSVRAWNSRQYAFRTDYDPLHRPLRSFVQGGDPSEPNSTVFAQEILYARTIYGESSDTGLSEPERQQANLRGKVYRLFDGAGVVTYYGINTSTNEPEAYDFKGNLLRSSRQLTADYKSTPDWLQNPALEQESFTGSTIYDALNRAIAATAPDNSVYRPTFNEANLLDRVDVNLQGREQDGQPVWTPFVVNIDYNAKGQRTLIRYGNGAETSYKYDEQTFRLTNLRTTRPANLNGLATQLFRDPGIVQDLYYTYDPAGNITRIADEALAPVFHNGQEVAAVCQYTYDALYRLIQASGREHIGQSALQFAPPNCNYRDHPFVGAAQLNDAQAVRNYMETYEYDPVGNFEFMRHQAGQNGWTRAYDYDEPSLIEPGQRSNRLSRTTIAGMIEPYTYDAHGNMTYMPHLPVMAWDFLDQLRATQQQVTNECIGERTYYVYDASGQRVRKITELAAQNDTLPRRKEERLYLGGFEVYRKYNGASTGSEQPISLERQTLHIMDDKQRIALVEMRTRGDDGSPEQLICYQFGNHLGSTCLELDESAEIISYEEYTPYGSTSYQAGRSQTETAKRYRYTGMERDEESGLNYHGARYYAPWLGRWTSCDPRGMTDGTNLFAYARENPLKYADLTGTECDPTIATCPELMGNWRYGTPVPDRASVGHNLQQEHPHQVNLRSEQRGGRYNRNVSKARGELTVLVETGRGRFHTALGPLQAEINARVRAGIIRTESELIEATREAYRLAGEATGVTINQQALDRALVSNRGTLSEPAAQTAAELRQSGGPASTMTDASIEEAFSDPSAPRQPATTAATEGHPARVSQSSPRGAAGLSSVDADVDPQTGRVVESPRTSRARAAALARIAARQAPSAAATPRPAPAAAAGGATLRSNTPAATAAPRSGPSAVSATAGRTPRAGSGALGAGLTLLQIAIGGPGASEEAAFGLVLTMFHPMAGLAYAAIMTAPEAMEMGQRQAQYDIIDLPY